MKKLMVNEIQDILDINISGDEVRVLPPDKPYNQDSAKDSDNLDYHLKYYLTE